jgi:excisionase family DNA binding protein
MSGEGLTIAQAAEVLGVSTRTVRRFIKAGKLKAELVAGPFGEEYRIWEIPEELRKTETKDNAPVQSSGQPPGQFLGQEVVQAPDQLTDIIRELQEKNLGLAAQLGAALERIRNLESQVKLLTAARQPWWKRLFRKRG